jgi:hypothetical protein
MRSLLECFDIGRIDRLRDPVLESRAFIRKRALDYFEDPFDLFIDVTGADQLHVFRVAGKWSDPGHIEGVSRPDGLRERQARE